MKGYEFSKITQHKDKKKANKGAMGNCHLLLLCLLSLPDSKLFSGEFESRQPKIPILYDILRLSISVADTP